MSDTTVSTPLSSNEVKQAREILSITPVVALVNGFVPQLKDVADIVAQLESIVSCLKNEMAKNEKLTAENDKINGDIAAAGRLFQRMINGFDR